jgi:hypothetical protein
VSRRRSKLGDPACGLLGRLPRGLGLSLAEVHDGEQAVGSQLFSLVGVVGKQHKGRLEQLGRLAQLAGPQKAFGLAEQPPDLMLDVLIALATLVDVVEPGRRALELAAVQR